MDRYKYGVAIHLYKPIIKRGVVDFAVGADWTPAAGDVKISKDGGAAANVTNLPTAIAMGNTAYWDYSITATEMQAAKVVITVADSATKAVEDTMFVIVTYGNASATELVDYTDGVRMGLTGLANAVPGAAGGLFIAGTNAPVTITGSGAALTLTSSGGNGTGLLIAGNGSGDGIKSTAGATGHGLEVIGGGTSGDGLKSTVTSGVPIRGDITANITGNLSGSIGSVAAGGVTAASIATDAIDADALAADAVTEIWTKAGTELAAVPGPTASMLQMLEWIFAICRNARTQTATTELLLKDDAVSTLGTSTKSDDGVTFSRGEYS